MTNTLISVRPDSDVDAFLAHHGIKGMHWGIRKARGVEGGTVGRPRSAPLTRGVSSPIARPSYGQRRVASGQARLDRYDGSTKRAILHLAGAQIAEAVLARSAQIAVRHIPNPAVRTGANAAIELGYAAITVRNVNEGIKTAQARSANKKKSRTR